MLGSGARCDSLPGRPLNSALFTHINSKYKPISHQTTRETHAAAGPQYTQTVCRIYHDAMNWDTSNSEYFLMLDSGAAYSKIV